jgi:hypothetical protein
MPRSATRRAIKMLLLHNDAPREYTYSPALGLPDSKVGTFTPASMTKRRRTVRR